MIPFAWGDVLPYDGSVVLGMMFLALCLQLFYLLWSAEYYRKAVWLISALWEAMLFEQGAFASGAAFADIGGHSAFFAFYRRRDCVHCEEAEAQH